MEVVQKDELEIWREPSIHGSKSAEPRLAQAGQEGLNETYTGGEHESMTRRVLIAFMAKHLGAQLGAIYLRNEMTCSQCKLGFSDRQGNFNASAGEGMSGRPL